MATKSRLSLFLAVTVTFAAGCTPRATAASTNADPPSVAEKKAGPPATRTAEASRPDFISTIPSDAGAAATEPEATAHVDENPTRGTVPPNVDADDVREAVFRHMFRSNASGQGASAGVYCLEVEGAHDPTVGFLARLKDTRRLIRPVSGCSASAERGVVDKKTHAHGLVFRIERIAFKDGRHATVNGGYYEAGLSASGNIYSVELGASGWVVTKDRMTWIS